MIFLLKILLKSASKSSFFSLWRRDPSGFGATISDAVARSSIVFCNSVSADRIVMAASRLLRAVAAFVSFAVDLGSREVAAWSVKFVSSFLHFGVWSLEQCEVWSVQCEVWSVKEAVGVRSEVWSVECVKCEVCVKEAVRSEKCGVKWSVKCGVWSLKFGVRRVQCEVWSVKTASSLAEKIKRLSREGHGRDRLSLNYRSFMFGKLPPPACPGLCYSDD